MLCFRWWWWWKRWHWWRKCRASQSRCWGNAGNGNGGFQERPVGQPPSSDPVEEEFQVPLWHWQVSTPGKIIIMQWIKIECWWWTNVLSPRATLWKDYQPRGWKWNVRKLLKMGNMITKSPSALIVDNKLRILGIACASSARTLNLSGNAGSEKKTDRTGRRYDGKVGKEICTSPCWG